MHRRGTQSVGKRFNGWECWRPLCALQRSDIADAQSGHSGQFVLAKATAHERKSPRQWLGRIGVKTLNIEPGSPWEKGYCESFNGKLREELLNGEIFYTLKEAQIVIENWRQHFNNIRPHSSLGYIPPAPQAILPRSLGLFYASTRSANLGDHNRRNSNLSGGPL